MITHAQVSDKAAYVVAGSSTATGISAFFYALPAIFGLIATIAGLALTLITIWYKIKSEEQSAWARKADEKRKRELFELEKREKQLRINGIQYNRRVGDIDDTNN